MKALLLENVHPDATSALEAAGFDVSVARGALDEPALAAALPGVELLGIRSKTQVSAAILNAAPDLLAIGAFCIGTNQIDLEAAAELGIAVFNAPFSNTRSVVELVIAEMISLTRRLTEKNAALHGGIWDKSATGAHEMRGRQLGIVGYGNIGSQLSVLAEALGMKVACFDTAEKLVLGNTQVCGSLDQLLEISDIVTLHVDGRPGNAGMFGADQFAQMRTGAVFLNLSRGFVLDNQALAAALASGQLSGAAIDVFPEEPLHQGDSFESDLRGLANVILTPHIGGSTEEAQQDIGRFVAGKLRDYVVSGSTMLSVNLPPIAMPQRPATRRLALLHTNTPGVLAAVNGLLAEHNVNVEGQVLATGGQLGYLLTDIACDYQPDVVQAVAAMPQTTRLRVLAGPKAHHATEDPDMSLPSIGALTSLPASEHPELLAPRVAEALAVWQHAESVAVVEIDPAIADTAAMMEALSLPMTSGANCVVVAGRRNGAERVAACVVRADTKVDVNNLVKQILDVRKPSFLTLQRAVDESAMEFGGITPLGLPTAWRVLVDSRVADIPVAIIGSGVRRSKLLLPGRLLAELPGAEVIEHLGR